VDSQSRKLGQLSEREEESIHHHGMMKTALKKKEKS
jgi:hypothetical protein